MRAIGQQTFGPERPSRARATRGITCFIAGAVLVLLVWSSPTEAAISPGCLPSPMPVTPGPGAAALDTVNFGETMHVDLWRQPCLDGSGSVPLMRVAPTTDAAFLCSGDFTLRQNGVRYNALLLPAPTSERLCADLAAPTTVILDGAGGPAIAFNGSEAFTLVFAGWENGAPKIFEADLSREGPAPVGITAAVLPGSRSVRVGTAATAFVTLIASGAEAATNCVIAAPTDIPARFEFRMTDPVTNAVTGSANVPATIPAGGFQTFVVALTPTAPFLTAELELTFQCAGIPPAPVIKGVNTFLLSAATGAAPDIVAVAATMANNGIVDIPGPGGTGAFAVATVNVGSAGGPITVAADTGDAYIPVSLAICKTDASGTCASTPSPSATVEINAGDTPTFAVFVTTATTVGFDPAANRVFVRFMDADYVTRGTTSVAVRTRQ